MILASGIIYKSPPQNVPNKRYESDNDFLFKLYNLFICYIALPCDVDGIRVWVWKRIPQ